MRPFVSNHVRFVHVLKHPNILQFHEWYETSNHLWLVMDLCIGGSLEQVIKEEGFLPESMVRKFGADIVRGLQYIHSRGVLFDEMRPCRFLLDGNGVVKLFDFSYAHIENESLEDVLDRFNDEDEFNHSHALEYRSTSVFAAPESFESGSVSVLSDYWGLGCLLYYMCTGCLPFGGGTTNERTERVLTEELALPDSPGKGFSPSFLSLLNSLLLKSPGKRITFPHLIEHEFWQGCLYDLGASSLTTKLVPTGNAPSLSNEAVLDNELGSLRPVQNSSRHSVELDLSANDVNHESEVGCIGAPMDAVALHRSAEVSGIPSEAATFTLHATSGTVSFPVESTPDSHLNPAIGYCSRRPSVSEPQPRMTQSEYQEIRTIPAVDDELTDPPIDDTDLMFAPRPIRIDTRSNLAMVYPWGDDAPTLPNEPKLLLNIWHYLRGSQPHLTSNEQHSLIRSIVSSPPTWRPIPLTDYSRWIRTVPPPKVDGLCYILNSAALRMATPAQLEAHFEQLVNIFIAPSSDSQETPSTKSYKLFPFRSPSRSSRSNLLSYLIWFLASSTSSIGRTSVASLRHQPHLRLIGNASMPKLLAEIARQLKSFASLAPDFAVGLCQLCCLLLHRVGAAVIQQLNDSTFSSPQDESLTAFASQIPNCLASLIEILREPASRTGTRLRHASVIALGELLVCSVCLLRIEILETESSSIRTDNLPELSSSQWQTAVHHLLRCLVCCPPDTSAASTISESSGSIGFERIATDNVNGRHGRNTNGCCGSRDGATGKLTGLHVRLCASRSIDAFVTAMIGCGLHDVSPTQVTAPPCVHAVSTPEVVYHLWSDGLMYTDSGHSNAPAALRNQLHHEISLSCASALAGIIFLNPGLFISGLVDRVGIAAFVALLEPPLGGMACQQTGTVARLLSMATTGLLVPLSSRIQHSSGITSGRRTGEPHGSVPLRRLNSPANITGVGAGTPASCRRILSDPRFFVTLFRHLKSPHPMIRAKAYLLCSAVLSTCPKESTSAAFDAQLAAFLGRDSKSTGAIQNRYLGVQPAKSITMFSTDLSESSCVLYLAATSRYLADLLATYIVPLICQQLLIALGCITSSNSRTQTPVNARKTSRTNWLIGHGPRSGSVMSDFNASLPNATVALPNMTAVRAWLPAFSCLPVLLSTCPEVRLRLLMPAPESSEERARPPEFCFLSVLGKLLDLWASVNPISSAVTVADVHQSGSVKHSLLGITLTITEDLSQHSELVESRRRDFVCLVLPGLARLAVAPKARPETRAICVKIVAKLAETLLSDSVYEVPTRSLIELNRTSRPLSIYESRRASTGQRPLSADVDLLLQQCSTSTEPSGRIHSVLALSETHSEDLMVQSCYNPRDFNTGSTPSGIPDISRPRRLDRKPMAATLGSAVQPPTSDVLMSLFEVVNRLMIPYAELLVQCPEITVPTAFIRLLNLLLNAATILSPSARVHQPTAEGDCTSDFPEPSVVTAARNLVLSLEGHGLNVIIVRLLASQLLVPDELNHSAGAGVTTKLHGSVTSSLCFSIYQLVPLLLQWPKEVRPSHLIVELRLLELVFIACLQLGELLFPPDPHGVGEVSSHRSNKKRPLTSTSSRPQHSPQHPLVNPYHSIFWPMCIPLVAGLHAMNSLLTYVASVVRVALAIRTTGASDGESAATAAEELLFASRPPPTLAGLLARLIGLWKPVFKVQAESTDSARTTVYGGSSVEDDTCSQLCDAALTGLTNFASLFAGEYSRSAMTPSSAASLSLGLLRLHEEDQRLLRRSRSPICSNWPAERSSLHPLGRPLTDGMKPLVQARRRIRLLLRVIRRLVFSDPVCRSRLANEATETGVANLYTTLHFLLQKTQCGPDALSAKLIREILDHTSSFCDRCEMDANFVDATETSSFRSAQPTSPSTPAMGPTAAV